MYAECVLFCTEDKAMPIRREFGENLFDILQGFPVEKYPEEETSKWADALPSSQTKL
jgi:hypothetical protein